jgi:hypothetical protein
LVALSGRTFESIVAVPDELVWHGDVVVGVAE